MAKTGRADTLTAELDGRTITLSNLGKVFYPETGTTKGEVLDYYARIGSTVLPHLRDRPLTLKRYPDGVRGLFFYQKDAPAHRPKWIRTSPVPRGDGSKINYCIPDDLSTLMWLANIANLELHPFQHTIKDLTCPTTMAFDLDPGPGTDVTTCARVALLLRDRLKSDGLRAYAKTSGSKGLQPYVPVNTPTSYDSTKGYSRQIGEELARSHPASITAMMSKDLRRNRVFVDWSQNDEHKTTVGVYSLRARELPTVSTPVTWKEVEAAAASGDAEDLRFRFDEVIRRVKKRGDLFSAVLTEKQVLPPDKDAVPRKRRSSGRRARPSAGARARTRAA